MSTGLLFWLPRTLAMGFILFLSAFALDVFGEYEGWDIVPALFMHLLPSFALIIAMIFAWKRDLVGAAVFFMMAGGYVWMVGPGRHWSWYVAISVPAAIIGLLFLAGWIKKRRS
jgi:hypothetical protein